jgi:hypothetical protein
MVHYQSSMDKQYSGDSHFREQDFIQTNPHSALTWILMSCPLVPQPARNLLRTSPSLAHHVTVFLADKGILMANFSCRSGLMVHQRHPVIGRRGTPLSGGCLYIGALGWAPTVQSPAFRRRVMSGSEAWVFMLGGDLIVGVISLTTLGLAYLHICLSFSALVS